MPLVNVIVNVPSPLFAEDAMPFPAAPVTPVAPVAPSEPSAPAEPVAPVAPVSPIIEFKKSLSLPLLPFFNQIS